MQHNQATTLHRALHCHIVICTVLLLKPRTSDFLHKSVFLYDSLLECQCGGNLDFPLIFYHSQNSCISGNLSYNWLNGQKTEGPRAYSHYMGRSARAKGSTFLPLQLQNIFTIVYLKRNDLRPSLMYQKNIYDNVRNVLLCKPER